MFRHPHNNPQRTPTARPATAPCESAQTGGGGRRCRTLVVMLSVLALLAVGRAWAAEPASVGEHQLKAALLPKLAMFIQWPAKAFSAARGPLVIGVLGENPFGQHLEELARGRVVGGHPLSVQMCRDPQEAARCHVVFISGRDAKNMEETLRLLAGTPVLTVSDAPNFASQGGMVNLVVVNQKLRLEVNPEAILSAELRIDPQLLQLAKVVKTSSLKSKP